MVDVAMFSALSAISAVIPTQRPKFMDNYMAIRVHSLVAIRVHSLVAIRVHSLVAIRV
jgi:hypothetical protein